MEKTLSRFSFFFLFKCAINLINVFINKNPLNLHFQSDRCNLHKLKPKQLVDHGEHEQEWGGYFIIKGNEKLVRMLLMTRRNYPIAIRRSGWKQRGTLFSDSGISIRCVRSDQTATVSV